MDFGDLRNEALKLLREASAGDGKNCGPVVGVLGRVLEDMDRKGQEWNALIQQARTSRGNAHHDAASFSDGRISPARILRRSWFLASESQ